MKSKQQSKSGGGITSKNNVNVPVRTGKPAYGVGPDGRRNWVLQSADHVTDAGQLPYKGERMHNEAHSCERK